MARPRKQGADWFKHSKDLSSDRRVKAVESKFGLEGYAVYCKIIESLTSENDENRIFIDALELDLSAGTLGLDTEVFKRMLEYMTSIKLLQKEDENEEGFYLFSQDLRDQLAPIYEEREKERNRKTPSNNVGFPGGKESENSRNSENQSKNVLQQENNSIPAENKINTSENTRKSEFYQWKGTQSRVEKSRVEKSRVEKEKILSLSSEKEKFEKFSLEEVEEATQAAFEALKQEGIGVALSAIKPKDEARKLFAKLKSNNFATKNGNAIDDLGAYITYCLELGVQNGWYEKKRNGSRKKQAKEPTMQERFEELKKVPIPYRNFHRTDLGND